MKKALTILLILVMICTISVIFVACEEDEIKELLDDMMLEPEDEDLVYCTATVLVTDETGEVVLTYERETASEDLASFLRELNQEELSLIKFTLKDAGYGYYVSAYAIYTEYTADTIETREGVTYPITELEDGTIPESTGVYMYTSIDEMAYIAPGYTATFNEVTYNACGKSATDMPIFEGVVYVITVEAN
ncbi:MAG: hypothetical protein R3Y23_05360 [Bacillota bacterium]